MIIVFFGQPHSGKTTLASCLANESISSLHIDGDKLRDLFQNRDFSREGRIRNLNRASDIAVYVNSLGIDVILSLVYPYKETRDYLDSLCKEVTWIYLVYDEIRGREKFHVKDFDVPSDVMTINTSEYSIEECFKVIENEVYPTLSRR